MSSYVVRKVSAPDWSAVEKVELAHQPWLTPCAIRAWAQICHDEEYLYIRMEAEEKNIRATLTGLLDAVCTDSCMEFFFAPCAGDKRYFNFEWNKLGALNFGFGAERATRVRQVVKDAKAMFDPKPFDTEKGWGIEYRVPKALVKMYFPDAQFAGEAAGNFYKCGDLTEKEHYMAWAPMTSEKPDFHRRGDFGVLIFE